MVLRGLIGLTLGALAGLVYSQVMASCGST